MKIIFEVEDGILKWSKDHVIGGESAECALTKENIDELIKRTKCILDYEADR